MKTWLLSVLAGALLSISAGALGYATHTATRLRQLEQKVQEAGVAWRSRTEPAAVAAMDARLRELERRLQQLESAPRTGAAVQPAVVAVPDFSLEQRVRQLEQKLVPHLEYLSR